jgi:3'-5' exoribonuclease
MKAAFVNTLVPSETVTTQFLVIHKEIRQKKTGEPYLTLLLGDRTGEIEAKMWDNVAEVMDTFDRDDFVKVKGLPQVYQNKPQLTVHKIRRLEDHEVEPGDYFPCSKRDSEEMWAELRGIISSLGNEHLRRLLEEIFVDPVLVALYKRAPAAKSIHHACLGGLIEHVLSLCALCRMTAAHYQGVDVDLLLAAAILHDIGKTEELAYERSFSYTAAGQLVGHIVMGVQLVSEKIRAVPGFPPKLKLLLEHMILSHHGSLEFGSPKVPLFPEALLFHHLDNLDSKFEAMRAAIERDRQPSNEFTGWISALERVVLKKDRFLHSAADPVPLPEPAATPAAPAAAPTAEVRHSEPAKPAARPAPTSLFGEKLQAVLQEPENSDNQASSQNAE